MKANFRKRRIQLYTTYSGGSGNFFSEFGIPLYAYSLRDLNGTNPIVIEGERSTDSATQTFTASQVQDGTDLESFSQGGDVRVSEIYCQVNSSNNIVIGADNRQPSIVSSGDLVVKNGKPSLRFITEDNINFPSGIKSQINTVYRVQAATEGNYILLWDSNQGLNFGYRPQGSSSDTTIFSFYGSPSLYVNGNLETPTTRDEVNTALGNQTGVLQAIGIDSEDVSSWVGNVSFGRSTNDSANFEGWLSEYIVYPNSTDPFDSSVSANQISFYAIS